jgi:hypothetical protein
MSFQAPRYAMNRFILITPHGGSRFLRILLHKNIVGGERNRNLPSILFTEDEKIIISTTG